MNANHLWNQANHVTFQTTPDIVGNFDIGFDSKIPEETRDALMQFVYWVEDHFSLPITLWVDFKYRHYLKGQDGKPAGYRFYWAEFKDYPVFDNPDDIPVIELAVRTEKQTIEEILTAFSRGISQYFIWLQNKRPYHVEPEENALREILQAYWQDHAPFH